MLELSTPTKSVEGSLGVAAPGDSSFLGIGGLLVEADEVVGHPIDVFAVVLGEIVKRLVEVAAVVEATSEFHQRVTHPGHVLVRHMRASPARSAAAATKTCPANR